MVALPSLSPHIHHTHPSQPIDLPHRAPSDKAPNPPLAADTNPAQIIAHPASPSNEPQPPAQSEQQQQTTDDESAGEESAAYSPLLKDHVFSLYCAGQRSPAIAAQLGIPERTARHWIRATLQQLAQDDVTASPKVARQQRALAIESQRAAVASAWTTYHRLTAAHTQLLDLALMSTIRQSDTTENAPQPDAAAVIHDPQRLFTTASRLASAAARYLTLVINANREIAHLQGHAITQDARERQATATRDAADARQLEADLIRAFTTPVLPPEPAPLHASSYASSWPGGITTPQPGVTANTQRPAPIAPIRPTPHTIQSGLPAITATPTAAHAQHTPPPTTAAKTATSLAAPQPGLPAKTTTPTTATAATPAVPPLPAPGRGQGERSQTLSKTKIAAKTATPTPHALAKPPQPRRPASAKRKPQLILPSQQCLAAHPAI